MSDVRKRLREQVHRLKPWAYTQRCTCPTFDGWPAMSFSCPVHGEEALRRQKAVAAELEAQG